MLEQQALLDSGHTRALHAFLSYEMSLRRNPQPIVIKQGTFDDRPTRTLATAAWASLVRSVESAIVATPPTNQQLRNRLQWQLSNLLSSAQQGADLVEERNEEEEE